MNAACQERFLKCMFDIFNSQKQVVSEVTLRKEKQLLFKCTVTNTKCFIYYIISIKIIQFNLKHYSAAVIHVLSFPLTLLQSVCTRK